MNFLVLAVLIDSIVVLTMGTKLQRTARKEAANASLAFEEALKAQGPEIIAAAIQIAAAQKGNTDEV